MGFRANSLPLVLMSLMVTACLEPTQTTFVINTDVPCDQLNGAAITVGLSGETEFAEPTTTSRDCSPAGTLSLIGTYATFPRKGGDDVLASFKVVAAVGSADLRANCKASNNYQGCIVARRRMAFVAHRSITVPVTLFAGCLNKICDQGATCEGNGKCVPNYVDVDNCEGNDCSKLTNVPPPKRDGTVRVVDAGTDVDAGSDIDAGSPLTQQAYLKATNTDIGDSFGSVVSLSSDGNTLVVAAHREGSAATVINGAQSDNTASHAGAVYVLQRTGAGWAHSAYLKASNAEAQDFFGGFYTGTAISADGNTIAVGAANEDSDADGVNGNQSDNSAMDSGAVYIFVRSGNSWVQQAYLKDPQSAAGGLFGTSVALSADGNRLVTGSPGRSRVFMFQRTAGAWDVTVGLPPLPGLTVAGFPYKVAMSHDGNSMAASAIQDSSSATGIDGDATNALAVKSGAVFTYQFDGVQWQHGPYLKASNTAANDQFGFGLAFSGDGRTLAVGAIGESSAARGVNADQLDNSAPTSGAAYIFQKVGQTWAQQAFIKPSNTNAFEYFGIGIAFSFDGDQLLISGAQDGSGGVGINPVLVQGALSNSGTLFRYQRTGSAWRETNVIKTSNPDVDDFFAYSVSMSNDGSTFVAGSYAEDSNATGINGDQSNNVCIQSGAAYVFSR